MPVKTIARQEHNEGQHRGVLRESKPTKSQDKTRCKYKTRGAAALVTTTHTQKEQKKSASGKPPLYPPPGQPYQRSQPLPNSTSSSTVAAAANSSTATDFVNRGQLNLPPAKPPVKPSTKSPGKPATTPSRPLFQRARLKPSAVLHQPTPVFSALIRFIEKVSENNDGFSICPHAE